MTTLRVLVTVGADDRAFRQLVATVADWAADRPDVVLVVHHGRGAPAPGAERNLATLAGHELDSELLAAQVVVCDATASIVREAHRHGHVPLVLPRRYRWWRPSRARVQAQFAAHLARLDLALVAPTPADLVSLLNHALLDPPVSRPPAGAQARVRSAARQVERLLRELTLTTPRAGADDVADDGEGGPRAPSA